MVQFTFISKLNRRRTATTRNSFNSSNLLALLLVVVSISSISASVTTQQQSNPSLRSLDGLSSSDSNIISEALSKSKVLTKRRKDAEEEEEDESNYESSSKGGKGKSSKQDEYEEEEDGYGYDDVPYASSSKKPSPSSKGSSYKSNESEEDGQDEEEESSSKSKGSSASASKSQSWHRMTRSGYSEPSPIATSSSKYSKSDSNSGSSSKSKSSTSSSPTSEPTPIGTATVPVLKTWSSDTSTWVVTDGWSTSTEYSSPTPTVGPDAGAAAVGLPQAQATQAWVTKKAKVAALAIASASSKAVAAAAISTAAPVAAGSLSNVDYSWMTPSPGQVYSGGQDVVLAWQAAEAPDLDSLHLRLCLLKSADDIRIGSYNSGASCGEAASTEVQQAGNNAWQIAFPAPNVTVADSFYVVLQVKAAASSASSEGSDSSDSSESSSNSGDKETGSDKKFKDEKSKWSSLGREKRGRQAPFSIRDDSSSSSQMLSPAFVLAPFGSDTSAATIQAAAQIPNSDSSNSSDSSDSSDKHRPSNALAIALPLSIAGTIALAALGLMCYRRGQRGNSTDQEAHRRMLEASRMEDRKEREELTRQLTMAMAVTSSGNGSSTRSSRLGSSATSAASSMTFVRRGSDKDLPKPPPQAVALRDEEERYTSYAPSRRAQPLERSRTRSHHSSRSHQSRHIIQSPRSSTYYSSRDMLRRNESKGSSSYYHSRCDCSSCDSESSISSGSSSPTSHGSYRQGYGQRYFLDDPTPPSSRRSHHRHHRSDPFGYDFYSSSDKDKEAMRYADARLAAMQLPHLSMNMPSLPPAPMMERVHSSSPPHYGTTFMRSYPSHQVPQLVSLPQSQPQQPTSVQIPAPAVVQQQEQQPHPQVPPPPPPMMIFTSPTESQNSSAYYDAASAVNVAAPIARAASSQAQQQQVTDGFGGFVQTPRIVSSPPLGSQQAKSLIPDILRPSSPVGVASSSKTSTLPSLPNPFELLGLKSKVEVASPASTYSQSSTPAASPQPQPSNLGLPVQRTQGRSVSSSFAEASLNTGVRGSVNGQASPSSVQKAGEAQAIYEKLREVLKGGA